MSFRLAVSARVVIAAVSIGLGAAACGTADEPAAVTTSTADSRSPSTSATAVSEPGVSADEVAELERQLDEIDRVLADIETQLAQD